MTYIVHSDMYNPTKTTSMVGAKYFLLFVDDFSNKMWVYFLNKRLGHKTTTTKKGNIL